MPLFVWNKDYAVGVKSLDSQHTNLFAIRYTEEHFAAEERRMEATHYPALAAHREHHRALSQKVGDFMARFEKGDGAVNMDLLEFLRDWLKSHIQREDQEYGPWLNEHGVH